MEESPLGDDPWYRVNRLMLLHQTATAIVVETGLNGLGWTFSDASDYYRTHESLNPRGVLYSIQRMLLEPGQLLGYFYGYRKLLDIRDEAMNRAGEAFNLREFHSILLAEGAIPPSIARQRVLARYPE